MARAGTRPTGGVRRLLAYGLLGVLAAAFLSPWAGGHFLADDWMILARNQSVNWGDVPGWFLGVRHDWYRPMFELATAIGWRVFGVNPGAFHFVGLSLYAAVAGLVGLLGAELSGDRRIGILSIAFFSVQGHHAESVLWFAAYSELLLGVFALVSLLAYDRYRSDLGRRWLAVGYLSFALALASKETAVAIPVVWAAATLLLGSDRAETDARDAASRWLPVVVALVLGAGYAVWRLASGNPYPVEVTAVDAARNIGHYLTLQVSATPIDFDYTAARPLTVTGLLAVLVTATSLASLGYGGLAILSRRGRPSTNKLRMLAFATAFWLATLVPVTPIVTERTAFLSSAGIAWGLATFFTIAWDRVGTQDSDRRRLLSLAIVAFFLAHAATSIYRASVWSSAGQQSRAFVSQLGRQLDSVPPGTEVWIANLPDHVGYAYVFRNAFPGLGEVLGVDHPLNATLDVELAGRPAPGAEAARRSLGAPADAVVWWYEDGELLSR